MSTKAPLARVKEEFGGKDKLVDTIVSILGSDDEPKDEMRRRLLGAANSKLIRLHRIATEVKEVGGKEKLAAAAATEMGHAKDQDFVNKLATYSSGRLVDMLQSARRRARRATAPAARKPPGAKAKDRAVVAKAVKSAAKASAKGSQKGSTKGATKARSMAKKASKSSSR